MAAPSVEEHRAKIGELLAPLRERPTEPVPLAHSAGRVNARDITSPIDLPTFRNSQMDGYAVYAADIAAAPSQLPIVGTIAAGGDPGALKPGAAVRIMTGAPIPDGADCVVPVEDCSENDDNSTVTINRSYPSGTFVRNRASDIAAGTTVLRAGSVLNPQRVAALAAVGITHVDVVTRPRVAIVTTGSELVAAGQPLLPGQVYNSNGITLATLAAANGADVVSVAHSTDDPAQFREVLNRAGEADVVLTSGGVSMGKFEVVREVLSALGGEFGHIAMQPGGPQGLSRYQTTPILSFPGNPVSTLVSFVVLARPVLRELAGLPPIPVHTAQLSQPLTSTAGRRQFLRANYDDHRVHQVSGPASHLVASMADANALIDVPAAITDLAIGDTVQVLML